jgi:hypothetical protein
VATAAILGAVPPYLIENVRPFNSADQPIKVKRSHPPFE